MKPVQLDFDFGELPNEEAEKPKPALPHFDNPKCDNERLLNYQWAYKENGDQNALNSMYTLGYKIALKYISNKAQKNRHIAELCRSDKEEKAHNAATYIVEQYLKRPGFVIKNSMTGYLYKRVQFELYGKNMRHCDQMLIFYGDVPASKEAKKKYYYIVKDKNTGKSETFESYEEMHLDPRFKTLRKKRLVEGIRYGKTWKNYNFDILEVNE